PPPGSVARGVVGDSVVEQLDPFVAAGNRPVDPSTLVRGVPHDEVLDDGLARGVHHPDAAALLSSVVVADDVVGDEGIAPTVESEPASPRAPGVVRDEVIEDDGARTAQEGDAPAAVPTTAPALDVVQDLVVLDERSAVGHADAPALRTRRVVDDPVPHDGWRRTGDVDPTTRVSAFEGRHAVLQGEPLDHR